MAHFAGSPENSDANVASRSGASGAWHRTVEFFGFGRSPPLLLPRWLVLRAVGAIFVIVFAGIVTDHAALIGKRGVMPLADFFTELRSAHPNPLFAFLHAPSLFWLSIRPELDRKSTRLNSSHRT